MSSSPNQAPDLSSVNEENYFPLDDDGNKECSNNNGRVGVNSHETSTTEIIDRALLDRLVMDYLAIEGHSEPAESFARESGLRPTFSLSSIKDRMDVRNAVQEGDIENAMEMINDIDPEILDTNKRLYCHLRQQGLIELIRQGKVEEALSYAQEELAPEAAANPILLKELEECISLLAYPATNVGNSPVSHLLNIAHRQKTAGEANRAILNSQSMPADSKLPLLLKTMLWSQEQLKDVAQAPRFLNISAQPLVETMAIDKDADN